MLNDIKNIQNLVRSVLRDNKQTRNSDRLLMLKVWETQGLHLTDEQKHTFMKCASSESIRRVRQKIQEAGIYQSYEPVKQARLFEQDKVRESINL